MRSRFLFTMILLGCGDGLVGSDYLGTPLFDLRGAVVTAESATIEEPRLSLFWIGYDTRTQERQVVEQRVSVDAAFARFELSVFDEPPPEALNFEGAGIALIVVYADRNENDALNSDGRTAETGPDVILGASQRHLVVFARRRLDGGGRTGAVLGPLETGYHLFESDDASCQFILAAHCEGVGGMRRVDQGEDVTIRLEGSPDAVFVPNPAVPREGSGTNQGNGSLYGL